MLKKTALALTLALTPALAEAGTVVERFASSEYRTVVNSVAQQLGQPNREIGFTDCAAYACENRVAYWLQGQVFVKVYKSLDGRGWMMVSDQGCPPVDRSVCDSF